MEYGRAEPPKSKRFSSPRRPNCRSYSSSSQNQSGDPSNKKKQKNRAEKKNNKSRQAESCNRMHVSAVHRNCTNHQVIKFQFHKESHYRSKISVSRNSVNRANDSSCPLSSNLGRRRVTLVGRRRPTALSMASVRARTSVERTETTIGSEVEEMA